MSDVHYPVYPVAGPVGPNGKAPLLKGRGKTSEVPVFYLSGQLAHVGAYGGHAEGFEGVTGWYGCKATDPKSHEETAISSGGNHDTPPKGTAFVRCGRDSGVVGGDFFSRAVDAVSAQISRSSRDVAPFAKPVLTAVGAIVGAGAGAAVGGGLGSIAEAGLKGKDPKKDAANQAKAIGQAIAAALKSGTPGQKATAQAAVRYQNAYAASDNAKLALERELANPKRDAGKLGRLQLEADRTAAQFQKVQEETCPMLACSADRNVSAAAPSPTSPAGTGAVADSTARRKTILLALALGVLAVLVVMWLRK